VHGMLSARDGEKKHGADEGSKREVDMYKKHPGLKIDIMKRLHTLKFHEEKELR